MKKYVIALAGSPTSGKSSVLRALKELPTNNDIKVLFLDETATVFLHNRPSEVSAFDSPIIRQHYILKSQMHSEELLLDNASDAQRPTLLITDRGAIDAMVYLTDEEFPLLGIDSADLYSRYDHVIFLEGSPENFHDDPTTTRVEADYDEISALSRRAIGVWSKHPSFTEIPQQDKVETKIQLVAERINELMGTKIF